MIKKYRKLFELDILESYIFAQHEQVFEDVNFKENRRSRNATRIFRNESFIQ